MPRSAITRGFPNPTYVTELGNRSSITHGGTYLVERGAISAAQSATIGNLTLSAVAKAIVGASAGPTIGNLTLSATGKVIVAAACSSTIDPITLSASETETVVASLDATIDPITLAATAKVIVKAALDTTIDPITVAAAGAVLSRGDVAAPWWWAAYVARHLAERRLAEQRRREAQREAAAVFGDGYARLPLPVARGVLAHDPDAEVVEFVAALLPWLAAA